MADFCKQCSVEMFGQDYGDLANLNTEPLLEGYGIPVICEGCGYILVNEKGECISKDCLRNGHG